MSRGKQGFFSFVATLATVAVVAVSPASAVTTSGSVASSDELAPEPVTNLAALPGAAGVELTWDLSASDYERQSPTGTDLTSGGSFANVNDVAGYDIWRNGEVIDSVPAGEGLYVDALAAGASIIYNVTAYDAAGNASAETDPVFVSLGAPPTAVIPGDAIDFGAALATDDTVTVSLTIGNTATDSTALLVVTAAVGEGTGFSVSPASLQIAPEGEGVFEVTFTAAAVGNLNGDYSDILTVRSNDIDAALTEIDLTASITDGLASPTITLNATSVAFSTRRLINTTGTKSITFTNTGGLPLTGSVAVTGDGFTFATGSTVVARDPGTSRTISINFTPTAVGAYSGSIVFTTNDPLQPTVTVPISGGAVAELSGPGTIATRVSKGRISIADEDSLNFDDETAVQDWIALFRADLAARLGISASRIKNIQVSEGSIVVDFEIAKTGGADGEPTATEAMAALEAAVADTTTDPFPNLGAVNSVTDLSEDVVLQAVGPGGEPVQGWFTRQEDTVGLADFFSFADEYGKSSVDPDFDDTFDIAPDTPDGQVELADFFVFADNYGKTVANADEIRSALE